MVAAGLWRADCGVEHDTGRTGGDDGRNVGRCRDVGPPIVFATGPVGHSGHPDRGRPATRFTPGWSADLRSRLACRVKPPLGRTSSSFAWISWWLYGGLTGGCDVSRAQAGAVSSFPALGRD